MFQMFVDGGLLSMSLLSLELIALLFAAWRAPAWVKELGILALVTGVATQLIGLVIAFGSIIETSGDVAPIVFYGGLRSMFITLSYALLIFALSLESSKTLPFSSYITISNNLIRWLQSTPCTIHTFQQPIPSYNEFFNNFQHNAWLHQVHHFLYNLKNKQTGFDISRTIHFISMVFNDH